MTDPKQTPPIGTTVWACERCGEPCWSRVAHLHVDCERVPESPQPARLPGDGAGQ